MQADERSVLAQPCGSPCEYSDEFRSIGASAAFTSMAALERCCSRVRGRLRPITTTDVAIESGSTPRFAVTWFEVTGH